MGAAGALATCLPVKLDSGGWQTAFFVRVFGPECEKDRIILANAALPLPLGFEADVLELDSAAVVLLRLEAHTVPEDPLAAEILLTPGAVPGHFESLKLLSSQESLTWFFGDDDFRLLHAQTHALSDGQRQGFAELLQDGTAHDALVRCTRRYDAKAALAQIASHYEIRSSRRGAPPPPLAHRR